MNWAKRQVEAYCVNPFRKMYLARVIIQFVNNNKSIGLLISRPILDRLGSN